MTEESTIQDYAEAFGEKFDAKPVYNRTGKQNSTMWRYLTDLAQAMDDAGIDMREAIHVPIRPTKENIKAEMWDKIQLALYPEIDSSTKLTTVQMSEVYENLNRAIGQRLGIHIPWGKEENE